MKTNWQIKKLGEVCLINMGQSPESSTYNNKKIGLPFYQGKKDYGQIYPTPSVWCSSPIKTVENGDILISVRAPVGSLNIANEKSCIGRGLSGLRANNNFLDQNFLFRFLKLKEKEIANKGTGSTFTSISRKDIENLEIPLPPLEEQKRIVAILDEKMGKIAEAKKLREEAIKDTEKILSQTLKEIFEEGKKKGWEEVLLKNIAEYPIGLTYSPNDVVKSGGIIVLRSSNIQNDVLDFSDIVRVEKKIKEEIFVAEGDNLMCSRNGSKRLIGKTAMIKELKEKMTFGAFMTIIRSKYNPYLYYFFKSRLFFSQLNSGNGPMINQITKYMLNDIRLTLPPLAEQKQIVVRLDKLSAELRELKELQESQLEDLKKLEKAYLREAFRGEV